MAIFGASSRSTASSAGLVWAALKFQNISPKRTNFQPGSIERGDCVMNVGLGIASNGRRARHDALQNAAQRPGKMFRTRLRKGRPYGAFQVAKRVYCMGTLLMLMTPEVGARFVGAAATAG